MQNKFIITLVLTLLSHFLQAQEATTPKPQKKKAMSFSQQPYQMRNSGSYGKTSSIFSLGYGVAATSITINGNISGAAQAGSTSTIGPFYLKYEHAIRDEIGIGVHLAYASSTNSGRYPFNDLYVKTFSVGALGFYHFNKLINTPKLDLYVAVGFGGRNRDVSKYIANSGSELVLIGKLGARFLIGGGFGIYGEVSADGMSVFNGGVSWGRLRYKKKLRSVDNELRHIDTNDEDDDSENSSDETNQENNQKQSK